MLDSQVNIFNDSDEAISSFFKKTVLLLDLCLFLLGLAITDQVSAFGHGVVLLVAQTQAVVIFECLAKFVLCLLLVDRQFEVGMILRLFERNSFIRIVTGHHFEQTAELC